MRLPQSSSRSLSIRFLSITILLAVASMLPFRASAAAGQLTSSPASLRFGAVAVGQSEDQELILTNTGTSSATISAISVSGSEFSVPGTSLPATLSAGQTLVLNVTFTPSAKGWTGGKITVTSNAENPSLQISTAGTGVTTDGLTANPASVSFGAISVGHTGSDSVIISNPNSRAETITGFQAVGSAFSVSGPPTPLTLSAGQSITLSVSFAPQTAGAEAGSVFISGPNVNVPLTGSGIVAGQLTISPASLSFGNVDVGTTTTQPSTFTASGGSVTISSASSGNPQFSITGVSFPVTINAGQSISFDIAFSPTKASPYTGDLTVSSNASSQGSETLSGTGIVPQYSVSLSWNPSTSQVSGYNVYRGTAPGAYSKINSALDANTAYTDNSVSAGVTYYYACTSVNSAGQESTYSTPIEVAVP